MPAADWPPSEGRLTPRWGPASDNSTLYARVGARKGIPHKFKIAVAGCRNGCTKPQENDLGIMGDSNGFTLFVGGKMGKRPRGADPPPLEIAGEEQLFRVVESVIDWFAAVGTMGEHFGAAIDRVGLDKLVEHLSRPQAAPLP